jgi:hypothetical protein
MRHYGEISGVDRLTFTVAYGPMPEDPPTLVYSLSIDGPDLRDRGFDDRAPLSDLLKLAYVASGEEGVPAPYDLREKKGITSWGADGGSIEVLLYVADHALDGAIGYAVGKATEAVFGRLLKRYGSTPDQKAPFSQTRHELQERARWTIEAQYSDEVKDAQNLDLLDELVEPTKWWGKFANDSGVEFEVTLEAIDGHPSRTQLRRRIAGGK